MHHISLLVLLGLTIIFYFIYVQLIKARKKVKEASSGIDVQLKKRYDLIPNLLNMAAKFMEHEKTLMEEITKLRTQAMENSFSGNPKQQIELENLLDKKLKDFTLSVENYPDLKSNQTMLQAMNSLNEVEEHIAAARRFYNASVNELKNTAEIFPGNVVAKLVNVKADMPFFEAEAAAKESIDSREFFK